jgi:hypothetical protein
MAGLDLAIPNRRIKFAEVPGTSPVVAFYWKSGLHVGQTSR